MHWSHLQNTKDEFLEILFYDRNQVYDKIAWCLGEGFLSVHSRFNANDSPFLRFLDLRECVCCLLLIKNVSSCISH